MLAWYFVLATSIPVPRETTADDFDDEWPLREPREVQSDRNIRFPKFAQEQLVGVEEDVMVHWNYDPDSDFVFLSREPARKSPYEYADWNKVQNPLGEWTSIRAPAKLPNRILEEFEVEGTHMVYLASGEMLTDENPSAWLISWTQFTKILPASGGDPEDIESAISKNPGFMPTSPF